MPKERQFAFFINPHFKRYVQSGASGEGLGWVELDLGCSTILLGQ